VNKEKNRKREGKIEVTHIEHGRPGFK
jgi:hypothetical protein